MVHLCAKHTVNSNAACVASKLSKNALIDLTNCVDRICVKRAGTNTFVLSKQNNCSIIGSKP